MDQAERSKAFTPLARGRGPDGTRIDNSSFLNRGHLELDFGNPALKDHCYVLVRAVDAVQDHAVNDCGARQALHVLGQLLQAHVVLIRTVLQIVHDRCETGHVVRLAPRRAISAPNCCSMLTSPSLNFTALPKSMSTTSWEVVVSMRFAGVMSLWLKRTLRNAAMDAMVHRATLHIIAREQSPAGKIATVAG